MITLLKPDFEFSDDRGILVQLVHNGYKQVNMCFSKGGTQRGGHYHAVNRETFYIVHGQVQIMLSDKKTTETYSFKKGDMFCVEKNVVHSLDFKEDTTMIVMYDNGVELPDGTKDIIAE